jgi:hypothetical protein
MCGNSSIGRATAFQAVGCEFDPRFPLQKNNAGVAQLVEQLICNQQVTGSNPVAGSIFYPTFVWVPIKFKKHILNSPKDSWQNQLFKGVGYKIKKV